MLPQGVTIFYGEQMCLKLCVIVIFFMWILIEVLSTTKLYLSSVPFQWKVANIYKKWTWDDYGCKRFRIWALPWGKFIIPQGTLGPSFGKVHCSLRNFGPFLEENSLLPKEITIFRKKLGPFPRKIHCSPRKLLFKELLLFHRNFNLFHGEFTLLFKATCLKLTFNFLFLGEVVS